MIEDGNHGLLVGEVIGILMAVLPRTGFVASKVEPVVEDGNYTNVIEITRPSGVYTLTVEKADA